MADTTQTNPVDSNELNSDKPVDSVQDTSANKAETDPTAQAPAEDAAPATTPDAQQPADLAGGLGSDVSVDAPAPAAPAPEGDAPAAPKAPEAGNDTGITTDIPPADSLAGLATTEAPSQAQGQTSAAGEAAVSADPTAGVTADTSATPSLSNTSEGAGTNTEPASVPDKSDETAPAAEPDADKPQGKPETAPLYSHPTPAEVPCVANPLTGEPLPDHLQPEGAAKSGDADSKGAAKGDEGADKSAEIQDLLAQFQKHIENDFNAVRDALRGAEHQVAKLLRKIGG